MATTGTTAFNLDLNNIVEEAFERCGQELRTGYDMRTARRSLNLLTIEWANRGINLWTIEQRSLPLVAGTYEYNLPSDTVNALSAVIRTNVGLPTQQDITIDRISRAEWLHIPNKNTQSRPAQYYVQRSVPTTVYLYPSPDATQQWTFVYYAIRRIDNAGTYMNTADIAKEMKISEAEVCQHLSGIMARRKAGSNDKACSSLPSVSEPPVEDNEGR